MVNPLQIEEAIPRRWPTHQKGERIQQDNSSFSEKIQNNLQNSLEKVPVEEIKQEDSESLKQPVKTAMLLQEMKGTVLSQNTNRFIFTLDKAAEGKLQSVPSNLENPLEDSSIGKIKSELIAGVEMGESKLGPVLSHQQRRPLENESEEGVLGDAVKQAKPTQLLQEMKGISVANGEAAAIQRGQISPNLQSFLGEGMMEKGKNEAVEAIKPTVFSPSERMIISQRKVDKNPPPEDEAKETTALLLTLSDQVLALQQLQRNPASFEELSQILGQLLSHYGNIQLQELPLEETQKLVTWLESVSAGHLTVNGNTSIGQMLSQWTADVSDSQVQTEQVNLFPYSKEILMNERTEKIIDEASIKVKKKEETLSHSFTESLSGVLEHTSKAARVQGHESIKHENVLFSDLNKKLQQKVEEIQKFVVKNERIFLQLNPEKLGTVEVYLKKQQDSIHVHVHTSKEENKQQLDIIFEDIKTKLKEQDIQIEITYTEREQKQQEQRGGQRERAYTLQQQYQEQEKQEDPFIQLLEGIGNG